MAQIYKRNFLSNVIFRIDFPVILNLTENQPAGFQSAIFEEFPILEPIVQAGVQFKMQGEACSIDDIKQTTWKFLSKDRKKCVELNQEFLAIYFNENSYDKFDNFKAVVGDIIAKFYQCYPPVVISRLGLRYINEITINEPDLFDWSKYINNHLLGGIDFVEDQDNIKRLINSYIFRVDDETDLNFKYGIFNSNFPSSIVKKEFILDYDCYTKAQFEKEIVLDKIGYFNEVISGKFENSITDDFRSILTEEVI